MARANFRKKPKSYHHGDLRDAMIAATEAILREHGIEGFSLREAARRAGVSPGAPAHHFANASGLLTEVALRGYEELGKRLSRIDERLPPARLMREIAQAYVQFALDEPAHFRLMFRRDLIDRDDPRYKGASLNALSGFARASISALSPRSESARKEDQRISVVAAWSVAHGLAHLALEDKLTFALTDKRNDLTSRLLPAVLEEHWPD